MTDDAVTLFEVAQAQAGQERRSGGRFTNELAAEVKAVPVYPAQPASSPWANDPVPIEPPLGSIDQPDPAAPDPAAADLLAAAPPEQANEANEPANDQPGAGSELADLAYELARGALIDNGTH
jgi:hypothetical protein